MSKKYLASDNEAPRLPIMPALWTATALKVWDAPEWLWGVFGILYFIVFVYQLVRIFTYEKVDL